jgi:hypothetical protein
LYYLPFESPLIETPEAISMFVYSAVKPSLQNTCLRSFTFESPKSTSELAVSFVGDG